MGDKGRADEIGKLLPYLLAQSFAVLVREDVLLPQRVLLLLPLALLRGCLIPATDRIIRFHGSSDILRELRLNRRARVFFRSKLEDVSEMRYEKKRTNRSENPVPGGLLFGPRVRRGRAWAAILSGGVLFSSISG